MVAIHSASTNSYNAHQTLMKLSSFQRINSARDDAAGLAISEKMRGQFRGDDIAVRNMRDSQSLTRTAEGALGQSHSVLQRMRELSIQANNSLLTDSDRGHIQREFEGLRDTLNAIGSDTQFNTKSLLDGSFSQQHTTTDGRGASLQMDIGSALASQLRSEKTGLSLADVDLRTNPQAGLQTIDSAIQQVSGSRGTLGATDNRLDSAISVAETQSFNIRSAQSRIADADVAKSAIELQKHQVMQQAYFSAQRMNMNMMGMGLNLLA